MSTVTYSTRGSPTEPGYLDDDVPVAGSHPAAALEALVDEAQMLGPLRGDPRVELDLTTADDHRGSGYMIIVRDRRARGHLGLTSGWTEMSFPATDASAEDAVLGYLTTVCEEANRLATHQPAFLHHDRQPALHNRTRVHTAQRSPPR